MSSERLGSTEGLAPGPDAGDPPASAGPALEAPITPAEAILRLPTGGGRLVGASLDLLLAAGPELRKGSLYIGLAFLGTLGPLVLLIWAVVVTQSAIDLGTREGMAAFLRSVNRLGGWGQLAGLVAVLGYIAFTVESRALSIALLAARAAGRPLTVPAGLRRSRQTFWVLVRSLIVANLPLIAVQYIVMTLIDGGRPTTQASALATTLVVTLAGVPFAYVSVGIVVGDVGPVEAVRRSFRIARARLGTALIVAFFAAFAQYLTVFGLSSGLEIVAQVAGPLGLGPGGSGLAIALTTVLIGAFVVALGTLQFTILAIAEAPQVIAFLALTRFTGGIEQNGAEGRSGRRSAWLTGPLVVGLVIGLIALVGGLSDLGR